MQQQQQLSLSRQLSQQQHIQQIKRELQSHSLNAVSATGSGGTTIQRLPSQQQQLLSQQVQQQQTQLQQQQQQQQQHTNIRIGQHQVLATGHVIQQAQQQQQQTGQVQSQPQITIVSSANNLHHLQQSQLQNINNNTNSNNYQEHLLQRQQQQQIQIKQEQPQTPIQQRIQVIYETFYHIYIIRKSLTLIRPMVTLNRLKSTEPIYIHFHRYL